MFKDKKARELIEKIQLETGAIEDIGGRAISFRRRISDLEKQNSDLKDHLKKLGDRLQKVIDCLGLKEEDYIVEESIYDNIPFGALLLDKRTKKVIKTRFIKPKKTGKWVAGSV